MTLKRPTLVLITILLVGMQLSTSVIAQQNVDIGILAYRPQTVDHDRWMLLQQALNKTLPEYDFEIHLLSYDELEQGVYTRQMDFVLTNPGHYIKLYHEYGLSSPLSTLVKQYEDKRVNAFGGVIFALNKPVNDISLPDIKSKSVAAVKQGSLGGYQMQAHELLKQGIDFEADNQLLFTGMPHDNVVEKVLNGSVDVGFVRTGVLEAMAREGKLSLDDLLVINQQNLPGFPFMVSTKLYPEWPFAALPHVDPDLTRYLSGFLLSLDHESELMKLMELYGFNVPDNYSVIETLLRDLKLPPFDQFEKLEWQEVLEFYLVEALVISGVLLTFTVIFVLSTLFNIKLNRSKEQLANIIWGTDVGTWEYHVPSGKTIFNDRWADLLGYRLTELQPLSIETWSKLLHPDDLIKAQQLLDEVFSRQKSFYECEMRMKHKDGHWVWILARGKVNQWSRDNKPVWMSGTSNDISMVKAEEEKLEQAVKERTIDLEKAREEAETANLEKSRFLANMSHELRTPMHAIHSFTRLAMKREVDEKARHFLENISESTDRLTDLLNDLLDLSKLEAGKMVAEISSNDLVKVVAETIKVVHSLIQNKHLQLQVSQPDELIADFDKKLLYQVITNLISNAIKFSPEKGHIQIKLGTKKINCIEHIIFSIQDEGIGIPDEEVKTIFDAFVQSSKTMTNAGGTGLGLAISNQVIELHHGSIWAEKPDNGQGAKFNFVIPVSFVEKQVDDIDGFIRSHLQWSMMIDAMLTENEITSFIPKELIENHHMCELGKWLDTGNVKKLLTDEEYERLIEQHALFHNLAGNIVDLKRQNRLYEISDKVGRLKSISAEVVGLLEKAKSAF